MLVFWLACVALSVGTINGYYYGRDYVAPNNAYKEDKSAPLGRVRRDISEETVSTITWTTPNQPTQNGGETTLLTQNPTFATQEREETTQNSPEHTVKKKSKAVIEKPKSFLVKLRKYSRMMTIVVVAVASLVELSCYVVKAYYGVL